MPESISWLHLSDLHFGLDHQSWLWPKVKHDLFRDIEKISSETNGWDLVFFTGDFTQGGKKDEFERLNKELEELWNILSKGGRIPKLCPVPGSHDLVRPVDSSVLKTITQLWWQDANLRQQFWKDSKCEYRIAIDKYFENYSNWMSKLPVPALSFTAGILPGDFSTTFEKNSVKMGIVGLNSTFIQIAPGDFKEKLDLHISQLNAVCDGDPDSWLHKKTMSVLLTHQPPHWLFKSAQQHYRQEIYPPGRFFAHFFGHDHESGASDLSEAGGSPRRLRQAPSMFGLEHLDGVDSEKRIHG